MKPPSSTMVSIFLAAVLASSSFGGDVRTYLFVGDAPAYQFSCGECSGPPYVVRAQVQGTFDVSLDFDQGVGTLHSLNVRLIDAEGSFGPGIWQPIEWPYELFHPDGYDDLYRPPFGGILEPAEYRPLGPGTATQKHWAPYTGVPGSEIPVAILRWLSLGVGYEPAPPDSWILSFDGLLHGPDGTTGRTASYNIYFEGNEAAFSYLIPITDAVPSIAAARATAIPEPAALCLACIALYWLVASRRRINLKMGCSMRQLCKS